MEKQRLTTRHSSKTWTMLQIKNFKKSHGLRWTRPQIKYKNPEHMYLKSLTPSVEKTEYFSWVQISL